MELEQSQHKVYYSTEVLDLKRKLDVLGSQGAYKDAKILKKKMKAVQKVERAKQLHSSKEKLLIKSDLLIQQHQKEMANLQKKHSS